MVKTIWIACLVAALAGCSSRPPQPEHAIAKSSVPLGPAPSSSLDTTRVDDLTTIELLKEKAQEIVELKKRNREMQEALNEAQSLAKSEAARAEAQSGQVRRLQELLAKITTDQAALNERVLSLEIEKHELEKAILNMKLAALAGEGQ